MKRFLESIFGNIPENEWLLFNGIAKTKQLRKGKDLHQVGKFCRHLWFLEKGAIKKYEYNCDVERTTKFYTDNTFFTDYHSVLTNKPSQIGFRAVEDCELQAINYRELLKVYDQSHYLERIGRIMAERVFIQEYEDRRILLSFDAKKRYEYLLATNSLIFQRFPLKDIASFLGVTPVSLSRLRKSR
ncbi:MAG: Crp/Fnr family transcriptional regulator [Candidatus Dadabacteria bacterium]